MRFFPSEQLTLRSIDPPERVSERLCALVAPKQPWCLLPPKFPFAGKVDDRRFELTCLRWMERPDRSPLVVGEIAPASDGCEIRAAVELRPFASVGLAAMLGLGLPVALIVGFAAHEPRGLVFAGLLVLGYGFTWFSVRRHAKRFRKVAEESLGCRPTARELAPTGGFGSPPPGTGWSRPAR